MSVVIDEVSTQVENPQNGAASGELSRDKAQNHNNTESDLLLLDRIYRLEKRQKRLMAD